MTQRNPLVLINGQIQELPLGDTVAGSSGGTGEELMYSKRVDTVSATEMYKGEAAVGANEASATWRICKIVFGVDGDVTMTWADGTDAFSKVWANRLIYTYI